MWWSNVNIAIALAGSLYQEPSQMSRSSSTKLVVLAHSNTKMLGVVVRCGAVVMNLNMAKYYQAKSFIFHETKRREFKSLLSMSHSTPI
jgi:hypothetical protein